MDEDLRIGCKEWLLHCRRKNDRDLEKKVKHACPRTQRHTDVLKIPESCRRERLLALEVGIEDRFQGQPMWG
jgi:hypothetical protein